MLLHAVSFGIPEAAAIITVIGLTLTALVAFRKLGPERDALFITSAQGAAVIMDSLIGTLREEIDRCRAKNVELEADVARLTEEKEALEAETEGLRQLSGRRRGEGTP